MATDGADRSAGTRRFDVVVRGYDRRQVDEHVSRLQRTIVRLRNELDVARALQTPPPAAQAVAGRRGATGESPVGMSPTLDDGDSRPRPSPRPRPQPAAESADVVSMFNGRMKSILQAAEEEAAEIRHRAEVAAQVEYEKARRRNAEVTRQRDAVVAELAKLRGQLDTLLAAPTVQLPSVRPAEQPSVRPAEQPSVRPAAEQPARSGPSQFQAPDLAAPRPVAAEAEPATPAPASEPRTAASLFDDLMADPPNPDAGFGPLGTATTNGAGQEPSTTDVVKPEADAKTLADAETDVAADTDVVADADLVADTGVVIDVDVVPDAADAAADPEADPSDADAAGADATTSADAPEKPAAIDDPAEDARVR